MSIAMWIIIILLAISFYQYSNPEKANDMLEPGWGKIKDFVDNNNPLNNSTFDTAGICPDINEPVCGDDGSSYKNPCEAVLAGILEVTPGAC